MLKRDGVETRGRNVIAWVAPAPGGARTSCSRRSLRTSRSASLFQPQINPLTGRSRRGRRLWLAGTVSMGPSNCSLGPRPPGLSESLSRLVQYKALARRGGMGRAAAAPPHFDQPAARRTSSRPTSNGSWARSTAVGIDPKRVTIEITENALLNDLDAVAERLALLARGGSRLRSTISEPAMPACLSRQPSIGRAEDRPRPGCRDRHWRARPHCRSVDLHSCSRPRPAGDRRRRGKHRRNWCCSPNGAATSTRASWERAH